MNEHTNIMINSKKSDLQESLEPQEFEVPGFWGFYESSYTDTTDIDFDFFEDPASLDDKTYKLFQDFLDSKMDYSMGKEFIDNVGKQYVNRFDEAMREVIPSWKDSTYVEIESPKEYNYSDDRLFATTVIDEQVAKEIGEFLETHKAELEKLIKDRFTSRSGFISSYSNDIADWEKELTEMDHNELSTVFEVILGGKDKAAEINDTVLDDLSSNGESYRFHLVAKNYAALKHYMEEHGVSLPESKVVELKTSTMSEDNNMIKTQVGTLEVYLPKELCAKLDLNKISADEVADNITEIKQDPRVMEQINKWSDEDVAQVKDYGFSIDGLEKDETADFVLLVAAENLLKEEIDESQEGIITMKKTMNEGGGAGVAFVFDPTSKDGMNCRTKVDLTGEGLQIKVANLPLMSYDDIQIANDGGYITFDLEEVKEAVADSFNNTDRFIDDPEITAADIQSIDEINPEDIPNLMYSWGWIRKELPQGTVLTWDGNNQNGYQPQIEVTYTLNNGEQNTVSYVNVDGEYHISEDVFYAYQDLDQEENFDEAATEEIKVVVPQEIAAYLQYGDEVEISDEDRKKAERLEAMGSISFEYDELTDEMTDDFGFANKATTIVIHKAKNESVNEDEKYLSDEDIAAQYDDFKCLNLEVEKSTVNDNWINFTIELEFPDADHPDFSDYVIENGYYNFEDDRWGFDNWYPEETGNKIKELVIEEARKQGILPKEQGEDAGEIEAVTRLDDKYILAKHHAQGGKYMIHAIDDNAEDLVGNLISTREFDTTEDAQEYLAARVKHESLVDKLVKLGVARKSLG